MKNVKPLSALLTIFVLGGCGGSGIEIAAPEPAVGLLRPVASAAELEASLKAGLTTRQENAAPGLAAGASDSSGTRTYNQDANVDEFDSVKYDGSQLFVAPVRTYGCCFLAANSQLSAPVDERSIRIFDTDPTSAAATLTAEIPLDDDVSVQGMYVLDDHLVALTATSFYGSYGDAWLGIGLWVPETPGISIYDLTVDTPVKLYDMTFDGHFIDSRRIADTIYMVSRHAPAIDGLDYWPTTETARAANETRLAAVTLDEMLPTITINGSTQSLVDPGSCYIRSDDDSAGYPVLTTITAIPVANPEAFKSVCYNEETYGVYISEDALYLTETVETIDQPGNDTRIHKFALGNDAPVYRGSGEVTGMVWRGGQADFRMNEANGVLRLFSTATKDDADDRFDHRLYLLAEDSSGPDLEVLGQLPNNDQPQSIGKANEDLFGVRFLSDRAYAVTFERIDPLYVFDLSSPTDPLLAGELTVTGVSNMLHPVTDDLLLGLGRSDDNRIKLELFDVSNLSQPLSIGVELLGGPFSFSEAQWNRHAFTYLASDTSADRLAIPADLATDDPMAYRIEESGLYLFEIRDKTLPNLASLIPMGSMIAYRDGDTNIAPSASRNRSVIDADAVYYVRDNAILTGFWESQTP